MATDKVVLVFNRPAGKYNAGEVAGFDRKDAQRFLDSGVARLKDPPKQEAADPEQEEKQASEQDVKDFLDEPEEESKPKRKTKKRSSKRAKTTGGKK